MNSGLKDWYTITDLAAQIGLSRKTVWAWIRAGKLKSQRYGAQHRINKDEWQRFLATCNCAVPRTNEESNNDDK
jgi:excisionase family DNA binding protein